MIIGIDIGGTTTKIGLLDGEKLIKQYFIDTVTETLFEDIFSSFDKNGIDIKTIDAIGCAVPGFLNHKTGVISLSGNLGYKNFHFKEEIKKHTNVPVFVLNDANAAALGEYWVGAGKGSSSIVLYTLGTGVGGGVIINGELIFGSNDFAGELGHGGYFQDERTCGCGLENCLEPMSSAKGITLSLKEETGKDISVKDSKQMLIDGDPQVLKAYKKSLRPLARHISIMQTAINPALIIIGGGPSQHGDVLTDLISELVQETQLDFISTSTRIVVAEKGNDAGIYGAAMWANKHFM